MGEDWNDNSITFLDTDDLFGDDVLEGSEETQEEETSKEEKKENKPAEEEFKEGDEPFGDDDDIFDTPESVGGKKHKDGKEVVTDDNGGTSPEGFNPYSSFAAALKGDNIFQFLDDETIESVTDASTFGEAFQKEIEERLDAVTKRVYEALNADVPVDEIRQYETVLQRLDAITDGQLADESEGGARLRRNILYQDFINRGFSEERARKQVERSIREHTDIEDAHEALESNKEYFRRKYDEEVNKGREEAERLRRQEQKEAEDFRKALLEKETLFGDIPVDKATRQKAYTAMTKYVGQSADGERLTEVQKYADENPIEFRTALGLIWALTDGFKKMDKLVQKNVDKKVRSNLKEIEARIRRSNPQGGSLQYMQGGDTEEPFRGTSKGWHF